MTAQAQQALDVVVGRLHLLPIQEGSQRRLHVQQVLAERRRQGVGA
jgi:hypothetical protein